MTDEELTALVASLAVLQQQTAMAQQKTDEQLKQTNMQLEHTDLQLKQTDLQLKQTDKQFKQANKRLQKQIEELGKQIGGLGNKFGSFTEGLALPSMTKILTEKFAMTTINPSVRVRDKQGNVHEIDVLAYNNGEINTAVIVEVKSHLREEAIAQMLRQLDDFPVLFPELADKKCYGIITAVDANETMRRKVLAEGLYFAEIHDEQFTLRVPDDFVPRCFSRAG